MAAANDLPALSRRGWVGLCVVVAAVVATFAIVLSTGIAAPGLARTFATVGLSLAAVTAALACLIRAGSQTGRPRWGWAFIGLGVLSWGVGQSSWLGRQSFRGGLAPFHSPADAGYLGLILLVPIGLLILPSTAQAFAKRARSVLDGLMIGASLVLMAWIFLAEPLIRGDNDSPAALYVSLAYPLGDVVIVTVVIHMLALQHRQGRASAQLALVGAGIIAFAISDTGFAYLNLIGAYAAGQVTDVGWFAGFALILLAACIPAPPPEQAGDEAAEQSGGGRPFGVLLPYVAVLGALLTSVVWLARNGQTSAFVVYARSALILLIVGRQMLTLLENRSLNRDLEARVADRTAEIFASEQRFHALVQHSSDVVTVVDADTQVLYQSESVHRVFGWPAQSLTGQRLTGLIDPASAGQLEAALRSVSGRPYATTVVELRVLHRDLGSRRAEVTITNLLDDPSVAGLVLNTRDISERKELQEQLVHEAYHDTLTQLGNRALFRERVAEALAGRRGDDDVTVLFLDLDGFKEVNDSLGHLAGDRLLIQVADRLRESVRAGDMVARFGGDEFAVLIASPFGSDDAGVVAQRIVDGLDSPFLIDDRDIHVAASIGLASAGAAASPVASSLAASEPTVVLPAAVLSLAGELGAGVAASLMVGEPGPAGAAEQLMRNADLAMYKAKSAGGSGYASYDPQMLSGLVDRLDLEADLRLALERGELKLHYQPTIALATGAVAGFEALIRWQHPTRGLIAPLDFIPIAEGTGLIVPLDRWVIAEACRQAVEWSADGVTGPVTMSVNVSVRRLDRWDLAAEVAEVLAETGMPAGRLCLEMTENVLMTDTEENLSQLIRLKALGVQLAIDDFGTGFSSLAYLRRFPVDTLKIDRSFVERLGEQSDDAALAYTIVELGRSLGMATVAEGVEEQGQLTALREMGCDYAQGFFFSRPVPAADAGRLLRQPVDN